MDKKIIKITKNLVDNGKIGYKAFKVTENGELRCRDMIFTPGKVHSVSGEIRRYRNGFHYCSNVEDTGNFYSINKDYVKVYKILDIGEYSNNSGEYRDKYVTDKIILLEEVNKNKSINVTEEFHSNGVISHKVGKNGDKKWFNDKGQLIKLYDEDETTTYVYNEKGIIIKTHMDDNDEYEIITEYSGDTGQKLIELIIDSDDNEYTKKYYNKNGKKVLEKEWAFDEDEEDALITKYKYDSEGRRIKMIDSDGDVCTWTYDDRGNLLRHVDSNGYEEIYTYDDRNNKIMEIDKDGDKWEYEYDENNNKILEIDENGKKSEWKFDKNSKELEYRINCKIKESYEYNDNGQLIKYIKNNKNDKSDIITHIYDGDKLIKSTKNDIDIYYVEYDDKDRLIYELKHETVTEWEYNENDILRVIKVTADEVIINTFDENGIFRKSTINGKIKHLVEDYDITQ